MISKDEAFRLSRFSFSELAESAVQKRNSLYNRAVTYSPKIFLPIIHDHSTDCIYCDPPHEIGDIAHLDLQVITHLCELGSRFHAIEACFKLSEITDIRQSSSFVWLRDLGFTSLIDYVIYASQIALNDMNLLPHINAGTISDRDIRSLKEVCISQSLSLESIAARLSEPGGPYSGMVEKTPARRLATIEAAGRAQVPFSTGILIGLGDTRHEQIEGLLAIRDIHERYGHIQEIVIQKSQQSLNSAELNEEYLWSIAAARLIFERPIHIQSQPNALSELSSLLSAGIDDIGGIPLDIAAINQEKDPWSRARKIEDKLQDIQYELRPRSSVYPEFLHKPHFISNNIKPHITQHVHPSGYLRFDPLHPSSDDHEHSPDTPHSITAPRDFNIREPSSGVNISSSHIRTSNFPSSKISN